VLVDQRFLRKKYKDPITNDDFQPLYANQAPQGVSSPVGSLRPGEIGTADRAVAAPTPAVQGRTGPGAPGGIIGVTSKSKEASIKIYNGRTKYNEWAFVFVQTAQQPGGPGTQAPGTQRPGTQAPGTPRPGQQGPGGVSPIGGPGTSMPGMQQGPGSGQAPRPPVSFPGMTPAPTAPSGAPRRPGQ
jgi:hypothetical protein